MKKLFAVCVLSLLAASVWAELSEGYTQIDYVESDGRQWVDTRYAVLVTIESGAKTGLVIFLR